MLAVVLALLLHPGMHFDPHADLDTSTITFDAPPAPLYAGAHAGVMVSAWY